MNESTTLNTCEKLSERASVGFGTVRRIKNGDTNPTIFNLEAIAHSFGRDVAELLADPKSAKTIAPDLIESKAKYLGCSKIAREIAELVDGMEEDARWKIYGEARMLARLLPMKKPALKNPTQE